MIDRKFGQEPSTFEGLVNQADALDPVLAQSLYDVQTSGYFGTVSITGALERYDIYELCTVNHVFWDSGMDRIRSRGLGVTPHETASAQIKQHYQQNGLMRMSDALSKEGQTRIQHAKSALEEGQVATFAAWEFVRAPRLPQGVLRFLFPRFNFDNPDTPKLIKDTPTSDIPPRDLELSVDVALMASAMDLSKANSGQKVLCLAFPAAWM